MSGSTTSASGKAPGKWEAGLTPAMIAQVKVVGAPRWAGAGQIAYAQDHNQRSDIYVTDANGGLPLLATADRATTPVFTGGFGSGYAVSPDGGTLVYTSPEDGKLYAVSIGGGKARRITDGEGGHGSPQFSPDGRRPVFIPDRKEETDIAIVGLDGEDWPQRISRGNGVTIDPQWSPDGTKLAYVEFDQAGYPWHHTRIVVADLAGGAIDTLVNWEGVSTLAPRWSPDSKRLVFTSDRSGWANLWTIDLTGGDARQLVDDQWEHAEQTWAPDGRSIVYTRNVDGNIHLMRVGADGGAPETLAGGPGVHVGPTFSPDGSQILFSHQSPVAPSNIYTMPAAGGERRAITRNTVGGLDAAGLVLPGSSTHPRIHRPRNPPMPFSPGPRAPRQEPPPGAIHWGAAPPTDPR